MYRYSVVFALIFVFNGANGCHSLSCDYECDSLNSIQTNAFDFNKNESIAFSGLAHGQNMHSIFVYQINDVIRLYCVSGLESGAGCSNFTDHTIDIRDKNNRERRLRLVEYFLHVLDPKCELLMVHGSQPLTHSGQVIHHTENFIVQNKCTIVLSNTGLTRTPILKLLLCTVATENIEDARSFRYVMFFSDFCTLATIFIYGFLLDLRNTYRKLLLGYFCSFFVSHISATALQINDTLHVQPHLCKIAGYFVYFGFLTTFLWLNIISIHLWRSFRTMVPTRNDSNCRQILVYAAWIYGIASVATILVVTADFTNLPESLKPGIGTESCFLKEERVSKFIYSVMPWTIDLSVNMVFFILTARKIHKIQKGLKNVIGGKESHRHKGGVNAEKENNSFILRLYIVTNDIAWLLQLFLNMLVPDTNYVNVLDSLQGFLIFVWFVLRPDIVRDIKKRFNELFPSPKAIKSVQSGQQIRVHDNFQA